MFVLMLSISFLISGIGVICVSVCEVVWWDKETVFVESRLRDYVVNTKYCILD